MTKNLEYSNSNCLKIATTGSTSFSGARVKKKQNKKQNKTKENINKNKKQKQNKSTNIQSV